MVRKVVDYLVSMLRWVLVILIALSVLVAMATGELKDFLLIAALIMVLLMTIPLQKGE